MRSDAHLAQEQGGSLGYLEFLQILCDAAQIRELAALRRLHAAESIILCGAVGVGKTHVAHGLGHQAMAETQLTDHQAGAGPMNEVAASRIELDADLGSEFAETQSAGDAAGLRHAGAPLREHPGRECVGDGGGCGGAGQSSASG